MSRGLFASLFEAGEPIAPIDSRERHERHERHEYVNGHWLGSTNIPLSVLTPLINRLVPRRDFPTHLLDRQDTPIEAVARRLSELGFANVARCTTCLPDAFGHGFVKGEIVWSNTFGEVVAHA